MRDVVVFRFIIAGVLAIVLTALSPRPEPATRPPETREDVLLASTRNGFADDAARPLAAGANVTRRGHDGSTPLHTAATHGHTEVCRLLLGAGADPDAVDRAGRTPLDVARHWSNSDVVTLLESHAAA